MNPIAIEIGPISIYWYGILIALTFMIGYFITRANTHRYGMDMDVVDDLLFKMAIALIVGARLGVVVLDLGFYISNPAEIFTRAGLGSHGAIITVMIAGYFWTKKAEISYWKMADAISPALPIGHILVRLGNFINGELFGSPTTLPWAVEFPLSGQPVHPVQLYEIFLSLIILPFALKWARYSRYAGYAFLRVLFLHSFIRVFLDFLRQHTPLIGPFVLTQIIALTFMLGTGFYLWKKDKRTI